jgi:hypothetical protein
MCAYSGDTAGRDVCTDIPECVTLEYSALSAVVVESVAATLATGPDIVGSVKLGCYLSKKGAAFFRLIKVGVSAIARNTGHVISAPLSAYIYCSFTLVYTHIASSLLPA